MQSTLDICVVVNAFKVDLRMKSMTTTGDHDRISDAAATIPACSIAGMPQWH